MSLHAELTAYLINDYYRFPLKSPKTQTTFEILILYKCNYDLNSVFKIPTY